MSARYRFLPWVRLGAATAPTGRHARRRRARHARRCRSRCGSTTARTSTVTARLHGPGDVIGLDTRMVVRTDPPHLASDFEPNYFPLIEFDRPDLPWLFTPAAGDRRGRLRPWLCLVVVRQQPGVQHRDRSGEPAAGAAHRAAGAPARAAGPRRVVGLGARPGGRAPDDGAAARQAARGRLDAEPLAARLPAPARAEHRLPRLPRAGLRGRPQGRPRPARSPPTDERELAPAWQRRDAPATIALPVYYHWEFSTGDAGDFESLVRAPPAAPGCPKASAAGRCPSAASASGCPTSAS